MKRIARSAFASAVMAWCLQGQWAVPTEPLSTPRYAAQAVTLRDGRVLVTGGVTSVVGEVTGTAEIFRPEAGTWTRSGATMTFPRQGHTATLLPDGRVLIAGGADQQGAIRKTEIYDPDRDVFEDAGDLRAARAWHRAVLLRNGHVLVTGGLAGRDQGVATATTEIFDPATNSWREGPPLPRASVGHAAAVLPDGAVFVSGGFDGAGLAGTEAWLLHDGHNTWQSLPPMAVGRVWHSATTVRDGVWVAGGDKSATGLQTSETYVAASGAWAMGPSGSFGAGHLTAELRGQRVLVTTDDGKNLIYDPAAHTLAEAGPTEPKHATFAVTLQSGSVLSGGGLAQSSRGAAVSRDAFIWNVSSDLSAASENLNAESCTGFSLKVDRATFGTTGGVLTATGKHSTCTSDVTTNVSWLSVLAVRGPGTNRTVEFTVLSNPSSTARSGLLSFGDRSVKIDQDGVGCLYQTFTVSPTNFPGSGGTGDVTYAFTDTACSGAIGWPDWITAVKPPGSNGTFEFTVQPNPVGESSRAGLITLGERSYPIAQEQQTAPPPPTPLTCVLISGMPPLLRDTGLSELAADLVLTCSGNSENGVVADVSVFLGANITSRTAGTSPKRSEALLLIDEPQPGTLVKATPYAAPAAGPLSGNVYQAEQTSPNAITFKGIPIAPPGASNTFMRRFRITNLRAAVTELRSSDPFNPMQLVGGLQLTASQPVAVSSPQQTLGFVVKSVAGAIVPGSVIQGGIGTSIAMNWTEGFQNAFRPRQNAEAHDVPGVAHQDESGFIPTISGLAASPGTATQGTRLLAMFSDLPSGVTLTVPKQIVAGNFSARLVTGNNTAGDGGTISDGSGTAALAAPGALTIAYEVTAADPFATEVAAAQVTVTADQNARVGAVSASLTVGPVLLVNAGTDANPIPSFAAPVPSEAQFAFQVTPPPPPDCDSAFTITSATTAFAHAGGSGGATLRSSVSGCSSTLTSSAPWLTITDAAAGTFSVAANTSALPRYAQISYGAQSLKVVQEGSNCTYQSAEPAVTSFPATGGTANVNTTVSGYCSRVPTASVPWIVGTNSPASRFTVLPNPADAPRTAVVRLGDRSFTVTQEAAVLPFACTVNSTPRDVRGEGVAELTGDVVLSCSGRDPAGTLGRLRLDFDTQLNSKLVPGGNGLSEILLLLDEPAPGAQFRSGPMTTLPSAGASFSPSYGNVYQGVVENNAVIFDGVPFVLAGVTGPFTRTLRITNLRVNAAHVPTGAAVAKPALKATVAFTTSQGTIDARRRTTTVAHVMPRSLRAVVDAPAIAVGSAGAVVLRFAEATPDAFEPARRLQQQIPGTLANGESGFISTASGLTGQPGAATHGTRLFANFSSLHPPLKMTFPTRVTSGTLVLQLVTGTNDLGTGGTLTAGQEAYTVDVIATNASQLLVYEVVQSAAGAIESVNIPVSVLASARGTSVVQVHLALAPLRNSSAPPESAAVPSFDTDYRRDTAWAFTVLSDAPTSACADYNLEADPRSFSAAGGSGSVTGGGNPLCAAASLSTDAEWITFEGTGPRTLLNRLFRVQPNANSWRTGTITYANNRITVVQEGAGCTYSSIAIDRSEFPSSGGTAALQMTGTANTCSYTPVSHAQWVTVAAGSAQAGATISVQPNPTTLARSAVVSIGGQRIAIRQQGQAGVSCSLSTGMDFTGTNPANGLAEYTATMYVPCMGNAPSGMLADITLTTSTNITSQFTPGNGGEQISEALLVVLDSTPGTAPSAQFFSGPMTTIPAYGAPFSASNANVFQGVQVAPNKLLFRGIPIMPSGAPADGWRAMRIANVRVDMTGATKLPGSHPDAPNMVTGTLSMDVRAGSGIVDYGLNGPTAPIAWATDNFLAGTEPVTIAPGESGELLLQWQESLGGIMAPALDAEGRASHPTPPYNDRSGYIGTAAGLIGTPGRPTQGGRLVAKFSGIPSGVSITALKGASSQGTLLLRLVEGADESGAGGTLSDGTGSAAIAVSGGVATVTYEVIKGETAGMRFVRVPVRFTAAQNVSFTSIQVAMGPGPFSTLRTASDTAPVSRYTPPAFAPAVYVQKHLGITGEAVFTLPIDTEFSHALQTVNAEGTVAWSQVSGSLPPGIRLSSAGLISGRPTMTGAFSFRVRATTTSATTERTLTVFVHDRYPTPVGISSLSSLPDATTGIEYNVTVRPHGGTPPYTWEFVSGSLPAGIKLHSGSAIPDTLAPGLAHFQGTPASAGTWTFSLRVTDSKGQSTTRTYALNVVGLHIENPVINMMGRFGGPFTWKFQPQGGTGPYQFAGSDIPAGLTLSSDGVLSGAPAVTGYVTARFSVKDATGAQRTYTPSFYVVSGKPATLDFGIPSTLETSIGRGGNMILPVSGGSGPYTWSVEPGSQLTTGFSLSTLPGTTAQATLSGRATTAGTFKFAIRVTDSLGNFGVRSCTMRVSTLQLVAGLLEFRVGESVDGRAAMVAGGLPPYRFERMPDSGMPPAGLTLTEAGFLKGSPLHPGQYQTLVQVTDAAGSTTVGQVTVWVYAAEATAPLRGNTSAVTAASLNTPFAIPLGKLFRGGSAPVTFAIASGQLPPGLTLIAETTAAPAQIAGKPTEAGTFDYTIEAVDASQPSQRWSIAMRTVVSPLALTPDTLPLAYVGVPVAATFKASGGTPPYRIVLSPVSSLAPGLSMSDTTGVLSGTPGEAGWYAMTFNVSDAAGNKLTKTVEFFVDLPNSMVPTLIVQPSRVELTYRKGGPPPAPVQIGVTSTSTPLDFDAYMVGGIQGVSLSASKGTTPRTVSLLFDKAELDRLAVGDYYAGVAFGSANAGNQGGSFVVTLKIVDAATPPPVCSFSSTPGQVSLSAPGGAQTIIINAGAGCTWNASNDSSWLTLSRSSGSGSLAITISADANRSTESRSASISVNGTALVSVTQFGSSCAFTTMPRELTVASSGGITGARVTSPSASCMWRVDGLPTWASVVGNAMGGGNSPVTFSVAANASSASRSATVQILPYAGSGTPATLTITQPGAGCAARLSTTSVDTGAAGGDVSVDVTLASECSYASNDGPSWVRFASGASGTGSGTVVLSIAPNAASQGRSSTVTLAGIPVQISQAGSACSITVTASQSWLPNSGGTTSLDTYAPQGCEWTAAGEATWLSVSPPGYGSGDGRVIVAFDPNAHISERAATVFVGGQRMTLVQAGQACRTSLSSTEARVPAYGGALRMPVVNAPGCTWTATSSDSWINILQTTGDYAVLKVAQNTSATDRQGSVYLGTEVFRVTQTAAECRYNAEPGTLSLRAEGDATTVTLRTQQSGCAPQVKAYDGWLAWNAARVSDSEFSVAITAAPNPGSAERSGMLSIGDTWIDARQAGSTCTVTLQSAGAAFRSRGGTGVLVYGVNSDSCSVNVDTGDGITLGPSIKQGSLVFQQYTVAPFESFTRWTRKLRINVGAKVFTVKQSSW